jgi:hypothetical protein
VETGWRRSAIVRGRRMILTKTLQCSRGAFGSFCLRLMSQKKRGAARPTN